MKNQKYKSAGLFLLAALMLTGLNAQSPKMRGQGTGNGPEHGGQGHYGQERYGQERFGQERFGQGHYGQEFTPRHERMVQYFDLKLSEDQTEEMKALKTGHYKTMKPLKNKMIELKARERTLLSEESVEMKAVNKVIDEQTDLMNKIRKLQVEHQLKVKSILTDEQVMKLEQRRNKVG